MKRNFQQRPEKALIMYDYHVNAGEGDINGTHKQWSASYKIVVLPIHSSTAKFLKLKVSEDSAKEVEAKLIDTSWGALVSLNYSNDGCVCALEVLNDYLAELDIF